MPRTRIALSLAAALLLTVPGTAAADPDPPTDDWAKSPNMEALGWVSRPAVYAENSANSDLAFWGDIAYQGTYFGFHIIDISNPEDPVSINDYKDCKAGQGDVIIWENILVRSWNSPAPANSSCDGEPVPEGFEGIHIFDVSNPLDPDLVKAVETEGGSHTATGVPDPANGRLIVYSNPGFDIIEIPLANPAGATILGVGDTGGRSCHDVAVILGDVLRAACAGGNGFSMLSLGGARGGTLTKPVLLYTHPMPATAQVTVGHAATFSWDGEIMVFGHEPGGGSGAECEEIDKLLKRQTIYLFYTETGTQIGEYTFPRGQSSSENCTVHNYNVVPSATRNILVVGSYQMGITVIDFTNPGAPEQIAYADPPPLTPQQLGGDWSTYWYDGHLYETDITRGLITWRLNDPRVSDARTLGHLNPQTQEEIVTFTGEIGGGVLPKCKGKLTTVFGTGGNDVLKGTSGVDVFSTGDGNDTIKGRRGKDIVCAGAGNDILKGGAGNDRLLGGKGNDTAKAGRGKDTFKGGPGKDRGTGYEKGKA